MAENATPGKPKRTVLLKQAFRETRETIRHASDTLRHASHKGGTLNTTLVSLQFPFYIAWLVILLLCASGSFSMTLSEAEATWMTLMSDTLAAPSTLTILVMCSYACKLAGFAYHVLRKEGGNHGPAVPRALLTVLLFTFHSVALVGRSSGSPHLALAFSVLGYLLLLGHYLGPPVYRFVLALWNGGSQTEEKTPPDCPPLNPYTLLLSLLEHFPFAVLSALVIFDFFKDAFIDARASGGSFFAKQEVWASCVTALILGLLNSTIILANGAWGFGLVVTGELFKLALVQRLKPTAPQTHAWAVSIGTALYLLSVSILVLLHRLAPSKSGTNPKRGDSERLLSGL